MRKGISNSEQGILNDEGREAGGDGIVLNSEQGILQGDIVAKNVRIHGSSPWHSLSFPAPVSPFDGGHERPAADLADRHQQRFESRSKERPPVTPNRTPLDPSVAATSAEGSSRQQSTKHKAQSTKHKAQSTKLGIRAAALHGPVQ